ncbi:DegV family protein [Haloplasma contractile]|uniref:DegV family protein n=1 Tax=Haloplasma contractile SSD-17B TaxID=1033810 RepID=U2FKA8_9MOLU|nr:DegV family protein [Haloplasma contractile]ERJ11669.1 DegV family protein [Haloplasma contractile SSD-17B]
MAIKILTDSACDLPKQLCEQYEIDVMPLLVYVDEQEFRDTVDITPNKLYNAMREGAITKTAQVTYGTFEEKFKQLENSSDDYIYIGISSQLSGTYQTAKMVADHLQEDGHKINLTIIDSKCASLGLGLVVLNAAKMAQAGKSKESILSQIDHYCNHMEHLVSVDTLEYLQRGGRVSRTSAIVGNMLKIKPILHMEDGKLVALDKVRGRKRLYRKLLKMIEERGTKLDQQVVGINHADNLEAVMEIKDIISEKFGVTQFVINDAGSAVGAHTGPGLLALYFLDDPIK